MHGVPLADVASAASATAARSWVSASPYRAIVLRSRARPILGSWDAEHGVLTLIAFKLPKMPEYRNWQQVLNTADSKQTVADFAPGSDANAPPRTVLAFAGSA